MKKTITKQQAIESIDKEIQWTRDNIETLSNKDKGQGFINGLEQAKRLIKTIHSSE